MSEPVPRPDAPRDLYRLERTLVGERLVPVTENADATHASIAALHQAQHDAERQAAAHERERDRLERRARDLELHLARQQHRAEHAETMVAAQQKEAETHAASVRRLVAKNAALIGEKRRLRDALTGKHPLPAVHLRVDVDHGGTARISIPVTLDTFPHRDRLHDALAEGRRIAAQHGGLLCGLRLDTAAWRAVIQTVVGE